ncbi:hypothetical protein F5Y13DRAFT_199249 [Hypoxylon sp. FL1857]|nr:hypothetical protein F5Y13DRAFT_199249 [Hypoxylon sp. FL1857]
MSSHITRTSPNDGKAPCPPPSLLFLRTNTQDVASGQIITRSRSSYDIASIIAARQLVEHQERYGSDAVPPEDVFASWLEENRECFIEARRASRNLNASGPKTRSTQDLASSLTRPSGSKAGERSSKRRAKRDAQESGNAPGISRHIQKCRRRVCSMKKKVGRLLSRAGAAMYSRGREWQTQPVDSEEKDVHDGHRSELLQGSKNSAQYPTGKEQQEIGANSTGENNSTMHSQQESPPEHPGAWPLDRIEDQSMLNIEEPRPSTPGWPSYSSNTATLGRSEREAAPSPPDHRVPFHISHVAHLAPTHIAAERARERLLPKGHQSYNDDRVFESDDISSGGNSTNTRVTQYNTSEQRQGQNKSSPPADRDALQARIHDAGFMSGELWLDRLNNKAKGRLGIRFIARPLRKIVEGKSSGLERGNGLLPRAGGGKTYGLDY